MTTTVNRSTNPKLTWTVTYAPGVTFTWIVL